jgi:pimeloyl-ACP methyl ester carboxylesterase
MHIVAAGGVTLHVQELGHGPPVVMVHGLIGSIASWYFTAGPALARGGRRVRMFDLRGHGRSQRAPTGYDLRTLAADLAAVVADLDEPFDLVGYSWGALVALRFALAHPARLRRLAIVEAPLPPSTAHEVAAWLAPGALSTAVRDTLPRALRDAVEVKGRQAERMIAALTFLIRDSSLVADLCREPDLEDREIAGLACPTALLYGERSACAPAGRRLARTVPGARLVFLPGGHFIHLDARTELTRAIAEHLDG